MRKSLNKTESVEVELEEKNVLSVFLYFYISYPVCPS